MRRITAPSLPMVRCRFTRKRTWLLEISPESRSISPFASAPQTCQSAAIWARIHRFVAEEHDLLADLQARHLAFLQEHVARLVLLSGIEDRIYGKRGHVGIIHTMPRHAAATWKE